MEMRVAGKSKSTGTRRKHPTPRLLDRKRKASRCQLLHNTHPSSEHEHDDEARVPRVLHSAPKRLRRCWRLEEISQEFSIQYKSESFGWMVT
jgi:hypothetical protein